MATIDGQYRRIKSRKRKTLGDVSSDIADAAFNALNPGQVQIDAVNATNTNAVPPSGAINDVANTIVNPAASLPQLPQGVSTALNNLIPGLTNTAQWLLIGGVVVLLVYLEKR